MIEANRVWLHDGPFGEPECRMHREKVNDVLYLRAIEVRNAISRIPADEFDYWKVLEVINNIR